MSEMLKGVALDQVLAVMDFAQMTQSIAAKEMNPVVLMQRAEASLMGTFSECSCTVFALDDAAKVTVLASLDAGVEIPKLMHCTSA